MQSEHKMWQSVLNRDPVADDAFVYGVLTTGIYCRPTCPSKRPKRENVRFFSSTADAIADGLRACKRCEPLGASPQRQQLDAVVAACKSIRDDIENSSLAELAAQANLSPAHFQRSFKRIVGISPKQYAVACRKQRFRELLQADGRVTDAIYDAGYNSAGVAYADSDETLGMSPTNYRGGAANMVLRFALTPSPLGWIAVAVSNKGVCAVDFGDTPDALHVALKQRFENASLVEDQENLLSLINAILDFIEQPTASLDLPIDVQGTAFQHQVWQALQNIPVGEQHSYSGVAQAIGKPKAVRAVASACGSNQVALAIPCHRVIRSDGSLGGYRWGVERKQALLDRESK